MDYRVLLSILLLSVPSALRAQDPPPPAVPAEVGEVPTFPAEVEQVTVDVVVTDKKHNPISGLSSADFSLEEDGVSQQIVSFEAIELPAEPPDIPALPPPPLSTNVRQSVRRGAERTFIIVFDNIHLTPFRAHRAKDAVAAFLKTGVRSGDRVTLMATVGGAWWSTRMPDGREELMSLLKRLEGRRIPDSSPDRMSDHEAMRIHIYHDNDVMARVGRRFETYGVSGSSYRDRGGAGFGGFGDPWVRGRASEIYYAAATRNRLSLSLIIRMLEALGEAKGRKSMVLVSDGFIYDPNLPEFRDVVQAARRSNVAIYFLDTRGLGGMPAYFSAEFGAPLDTRDIGSAFLETQDEAAGAESLASDSGGFSVKNSNDLSKGILRIAAESRVYYLLGYLPSNPARDGKYRKIKVRVNRKSIRVRARKGYYAPFDDTTIADRDPEEVDPQIQQALDSPYELDGVPLRMTAYVFDETLLGKASVMVVADVDVREFGFEEKEGRLADTLEFLMVVAHHETGEFYRYDQQVVMNLRPETREQLNRTWFPIVRDFELAEGGYQAKIVVRDKASRAVGTLVHSFEVPDLGALRTSTLVLSDSVVGADGGVDTRPSPSILARREFAIGSMFYCSYDVYGAAREESTGMPRVKGGFQILRLGGGIHTRMELEPILPTSLGRLSRLVGVKLDGTSPGEYEAVLSIEDTISGKTLEIREPFTVVAPAAGN
jgi:VWFA-related protein